jgi:hypothetical protein
VLTRIAGSWLPGRHDPLLGLVDGYQQFDLVTRFGAHGLVDGDQLLGFFIGDHHGTPGTCWPRAATGDLGDHRLRQLFNTADIGKVDNLARGGIDEAAFEQLFGLAQLFDKILERDLPGDQGSYG